MHLIDIAGAIACHRHTRSLLVTAAVDGLQFLHSIKVGDLIILQARVTAVWKTSLEVEVDVFSEEDADRRPPQNEPRLPDVRRDQSGRRPSRHSAADAHDRSRAPEGGRSGGPPASQAGGEIGLGSCGALVRAARARLRRFLA